jgi:hypothetical protein
MASTGIPKSAELVKKSGRLQTLLQTLSIPIYLTARNTRGLERAMKHSIEHSVDESLTLSRRRALLNCKIILKVDAALGKPHAFDDHYYFYYHSYHLINKRHEPIRKRTSSCRLQAHKIITDIAERSQERILELSLRAQLLELWNFSNRSVKKCRVPSTGATICRRHDHQHRCTTRRLPMYSR